MSFHFSMQKVLEYREQLEEEAKIRLAQAQTKVLEAEEKVAHVEAALNDAQAEARAHPPQNAAEFWLTDQYQRGLKDDLTEAKAALRLAEEVRKEAQKLLTMRSVDKKMLVKLKERQLAAWKQSEKLKEQHFNDEIATIRYKKAPAC